MTDLVIAGLVAFVVSVAIWAPFLVAQRLELREIRRMNKEWEERRLTSTRP